METEDFFETAVDQLRMAAEIDMPPTDDIDEIGRRLLDDAKAREGLTRLLRFYRGLEDALRTASRS